MRLVSLRSEILLYLIGDLSSPIIRSVARRLIEGGYEPQLIPAGTGALLRFRQDPPHIAVVCGPIEINETGSNDDLEEAAREFRSISEETQIVLVTTDDKAGAGHKLLGSGYSDVLDRIEKRWEELVPRVDAALDRWSVMLRLEEIEAKYNQTDLAYRRARESLEAKELHAIPLGVQQYLQGRAQITDRDELFGLVAQSAATIVEGKQVLVFRYLPAFKQLGLVNVQSSSGRAIGLKLEDIDRQQIRGLLEDAQGWQQFREMIQTVWHCKVFKCFFVQDEDEHHCLVVALDLDESDPRGLLVDQVVKLFSEDRRHFSILHQLRHTADRDYLTGALLRRELNPRLDQEISRARRLNDSVSVALVRIDRAEQFRAELGAHAFNDLCRRVGRLLLKHSRTTDHLIRSDFHEFLLILPHTELKGAAIKSERLRRLFETNSVPVHGSTWGSATVSIGVSSYPSVANDAHSLLTHADRALAHLGSSENRVCVSASRQELEK